MLFNSIDFAIFLPIVFFLYWLLAGKDLRLQNLFIVLASYTFYGWWDWRFLSLIFFSTLIDFGIGLKLKSESREGIRKNLLWASILVNLGLLGFFKYYNFFLENFTSAFSFFGKEIEASSLEIVLPVGISFYTFQTLSYTIDVYKKRLEPTDNFIAFSAFISFFPQLVAGPIERATNLLPQFFSKRIFEYAKAADGMRQILWGLFKKLVIADNCAEYANLIFNNSSSLNGSTLALGALFFTFQIYGDFSGYSDIAIGTARLFGFNLMRNFAFPYFSRDIAEFWRRWHISLSTWFRDYLYIPLGGSRGSMWIKIRNTFVIFAVSGFWHGASWTFIVWGILHAIYFIPLLLAGKNRNNLEIVAQGKHLPSVSEVFFMLSTFALTVFAWIFFRAESMAHAAEYISKIMSASLFEKPSFPGVGKAGITMVLVGFFLIVEWFGREGNYALEGMKNFKQKALRLSTYVIVLLVIYFFGNFSESIEFIYFQF